MSGGHRPSLRFQALKLEAQPAFFARAACVGMGALMFSEDTGGVKRARAICNGATDDKTGEQLTAPCPVKTECLEHVLERYSATEDYGVAGGLSARARRKLRRAIAAAIDPTPARPLKHGTRYAYNTGCGCLECSTWAREHRRPPGASGSFECACGAGFDTALGLSVHKGRMHQQRALSA